jgi:AcrR family transcriptional regulator
MAGKARADGRRTRAAILRQAADLATVNGLDGLTIGALADALGMSKGGLYAHFGSKEELQLATVGEASRIFDEEVVAPALRLEPGIDRLVAVCDAFFDYLQRRCFPGGCFFAVVALEMGSRPGRVKDRVAQVQSGFVGTLRQWAVDAVRQGQLPATEDPQALAFELNGVILAADLHFVLHGSEDALDMARQIVRRRLGATAQVSPSSKGISERLPDEADLKPHRAWLPM